MVNGELVAVSKREPGKVTGDGVHTIEELIAIVNTDPRRGIGHEKVLTQLELDEQANGLLAKLGYTGATVPAPGEDVYLRLTANLSTGGTAADMTDVVHPDNAEMAVRAIQAIGLDVGGVDFLSPDITQSYKDVGGAICEVNAAPGFRMHMAPSEGRPRDVAGKVIDMLFPRNAPSTIPIAALTGTNGKTTTARLLAHIHKLAGKRVGLTTTDGVYIDGQRTVEGDMTGPTSARIVLSDPAVEVAVLETARGGLLRAGMAMRQVHVGAVLNIQPDHLGQKGIETLEQLAEVKRTVVEIATDTAVLNADDPHTLRMAAFTQAKFVCYVTLDPGHDAGARAHPRRRARHRAGSRRERRDDHDLRPRCAHPAALDASHSGHARGARDVQRAERDVRGGDGVLDGRAPGGHPAWPADVRHDVLPGARAPQRVRRASVQGALRLRAQRARGERAVPAGESHDAGRAAHLRAGGAG